MSNGSAATILDSETDACLVRLLDYVQDKTGLPNCIIEESSSVFGDGRSIDITSRSFSREDPIISLEWDIEGDAFIIDNLHVDKEFRRDGYGLGRESLKTLLTMAHDASSSHIIITLVADNGMQFWSSLGAVPADDIGQLSVWIKSGLDKHSSMSEPEREKMVAIAGYAEKNPYLGFRLLSQMALSDAEPVLVALCSDLIDHICRGKDMILLPSEPTTGNLLSRFLDGDMPPSTRPLGREERYAGIATALSRSEMVACALEL